MSCLHIIRTLGFVVLDGYDFLHPKPLQFAIEKKGRRFIRPARVTDGLMRAHVVLLWPGMGGGGEKQERRRKKEKYTVEGKNLFRILCSIPNVPPARCEEVTLHPHVPHRLLPADHCAEHGPQEYGPAAGKGHTEEPLGLVHTEPLI